MAQSYNISIQNLVDLIQKQKYESPQYLYETLLKEVTSSSAQAYSFYKLLNDSNWDIAKRLLATEKD